jgi:hypothetical protein
VTADAIAIAELIDAYEFSDRLLKGRRIAVEIGGRREFYRRPRHSCYWQLYARALTVVKHLFRPLPGDASFLGLARL